MISYAKCDFLHFTSTYFVNAFICPSLNHAEGSHYGVSFNVQHFFNFLFQMFVFTYSMTFFTDILLPVGIDMFFFYSP